MPPAISVMDPQGIRRDVYINMGEVADIGIEKPIEVRFQSFFPYFSDTYTVGEVIGDTMRRSPNSGSS